MFKLFKNKEKKSDVLDAIQAHDKELERLERLRIDTLIKNTKSITNYNCTITDGKVFVCGLEVVEYGFSTTNTGEYAKCIVVEILDSQRRNIFSKPVLDRY